MTEAQDNQQTALAAAKAPKVAFAFARLTQAACDRAQSGAPLVPHTTVLAGLLEDFADAAAFHMDNWGDRRYQRDLAEDVASAVSMQELVEAAVADELPQLLDALLVENFTPYYEERYARILA